MLKVLHSESREECVKFMESLFKKPNPIILDTIRSKPPKSITVNWNNVLDKGVVSFCYYIATKVGNNFDYVTVPFLTEEMSNVS